MLPTVIYMHRLNSSHFESYSGGSIEQKSLFYGHFFFSLGPPYRAPYRAPVWRPPQGALGAAGLVSASPAGLRSRLGLGARARLSAFGFRLSAFGLGFRLRISAGFRLRLDSAWILVWFDLALA